MHMRLLAGWQPAAAGRHARGRALTIAAELDKEAGQKLLVVVGNTTPAPRSEEGQCLAEAPAPRPRPERPAGDAP